MVLAIIAFLFAVYVVISNIPTQAAVVEQQTAASATSFSTIFNNPVNAPYKIASMILVEISPSVRLVRAVSFVFYIGACIALFYALRHWHTLQASILTTAAFATNSLVLATARLGTPLIAGMSLFIFASLLLWQTHSRSNKAVPIVVLIALACLLYTPGAIWFMLILGLVYWRKITKPFKNVRKKAIAVGTIIALLFLTPLILGFIRDAATLREWLLLPPTLDWSSVPRSILRVPSAFIYRMPVEPLVNIARLPVFDIATGVLFLIGLTAYGKKLRLDRTRVMLGSALVGIIVGAFGELLFAVVLLLPFAYSVIAAGIEYLLDEWYAVFPRNPVARSFGVIVVTSTILFGMYYQLTRFFVVWPQYEETREIYNKSRIISDTPLADTIE